MVLLLLAGQGNCDFTYSQSPKKIDRSRTSKLNLSSLVIKKKIYLKIWSIYNAGR